MSRSTRFGALGLVEGTATVVARTLATAGGVAMLAMLALIVGNIAMRTFASPYYGTFELVTLLAVAVNGLALAEAQRWRSHIAVGLLMDRTPVPLQKGVGLAVMVVSTLLFAVTAYQLVQYALNLRAQGAVSESLQLAFWPMAVILAVGVAGLVVVLAADAARIATRLRGNDTAGLW